MTYIIIVLVLSVLLPQAIRLFGFVLAGVCWLVAALGHLTAALLFALAALLDRRRQPRH